MHLTLKQKVTLLKRPSPNKPFEPITTGFVVGINSTFCYINYTEPNLHCSRKEAHPLNSVMSKII